MAKPDVSQYQSFDQITRRLDDIVGAVRDRDVSLERSLDLFDEATEEYNTTTLVPYAYTDWTDFWVDRADHIVCLYDEVKESVAVRSVYVDEDGRELRSEEAIEYMAGIDGVATGGEVASERWYDFTGRATARPESGIAIRVVTLTDGTVKAYKTILR